MQVTRKGPCNYEIAIQMARSWRGLCQRRHDLVSCISSIYRTHLNVVIHSIQLVRFNVRDIAQCIGRVATA